MPDTAAYLQPAAAPRVEYRHLDPGAPLPENLLAVVTFGASGDRSLCDPREVRVGLTPLRGAEFAELWLASGRVRTGLAGAIRYAADADHLFGVVELDEREHGGIAGAAEAAYAEIRRFTQSNACPHLLRVWNHFDDINGGKGDAERYRLFCVGRAAGLGDWHRENYPAATAIGRRDGDSTLQIYWLAGRAAGVALKNSRQVNPWEYPRAYGSVSPQFSRGMLVGRELALISGTASILGHASQHARDVRAQLDESLSNLQHVLEQAGAISAVAAKLTARSLLRAYLRNADQIDAVEQQLRERSPAGMKYQLLAGDICRGDLLVEVEGVHATG